MCCEDVYADLGSIDNLLEESESPGISQSDICGENDTCPLVNFVQVNNRLLVEVKVDALCLCVCVS